MKITIHGKSILSILFWTPVNQIDPEEKVLLKSQPSFYNAGNAFVRRIALKNQW